MVGQEEGPIFPNSHTQGHARDGVVLPDGLSDAIRLQFIRPPGIVIGRQDAFSLNVNLFDLAPVPVVHKAPHLEQVARHVAVPVHLRDGANAPYASMWGQAVLSEICQFVMMGSKYEPILRVTTWAPPCKRYQIQACRSIGRTW